MAFLDYLRIIAFVSVLIGHTFYEQLSDISVEAGVHPTPQLAVRALSPIVHEGGVGVVLFFFISGYIITYVSRREKPLEFAIKRVFRIYPLYLSAVFICYFLTDPRMRLPLRDVLLQSTLLGDFFGLPFALGGVEWTLRIEVYFYFLMGLLALAVRGTSAFAYKYVPAIFFLIVFALGVAPPFTSGSIEWGGGWPATGMVTLYFPFLLIGSLLFLYEQNLVSAGYGLVLSFLFLSQYFFLMPKYQPLWSDDHHALIALFLFLLFWLNRNAFRTGPILLFVSSLTYSVYLFHNWLFFTIRYWLEARMSFQIIVGPLAMVGLFIVCVLMMYLVEQPGVGIGKSLVKKFADL